MNESDREIKKQRMRLWKRLLWAALGLVLLAAAAILLLPTLAPESAVRRQMEAALSGQLGRPVSIESAAFTWAGGLEVTGLRIGQGGAEGDAPLAKAARLSVRFSPVDLVQAAAGGWSKMPLDSVRAEGLELWLILHPDGRWNTDDLPPTNARAVQVTGGTFHIENRATGGQLTLTNVRASLGELAGSGQGYVNLAADLPGAEPGSLLMTANLNSLDFSKRDRLAGSVKVEWSDAPWEDLAAVMTADTTARRIAAKTTGRMAATFGRGEWSAEGAVEAAQLVLARGDAGPAATLPEAVFGFQVRQAAAGKPIEITLAKFSAPGVDLRASGTIDLGEAAAPAATAPTSAPAPSAATAAIAPAPAAAPPAAPAPAEPGLAAKAPAAPGFRPRGMDIHASARLTWAPLCQNIAALKRLAERFEQLGGGADASVHLTTRSEGFDLTGSADLSHTVAVWPNVLRKEGGQTLRAELDATGPRDFARAEVKRLALFSEAGPTDPATGRPQPLVLAKGQLGRRAADTWVEADIDIDRVESLLAMAPAAEAYLGPVEARGAIALRATCRPAQAGTPPVWAAAIHADLTRLVLVLPGGARKRPENRCTLDARLALAPDTRQVNLTDLTMTLAAAALQWNGTAQLEWPQGGPTGRFDGTLKVSGVESAGAILAPGLFADDVPLLAGEAAFDVAGELSEGRARGQVRANLDGLAVRAGDYFVKPAARPASVTLTGFWQATRDHYILAEADVALPGARLHALGRGTLQVSWPEAARADGQKQAASGTGTDRAAAGWRFSMIPDIRPAPESSIELRAAVSDMAQAVELSPALARGLKGYRLEGAAESTMALVLRPRAKHLVGTMDLTQAALDFGAALRKPRATPLRLDLILDILPSPSTGPYGQGDIVDLSLTKVEVRLADSVTAVSGQVKLSRPALESIPRSGRQILALLQEADVTVRADWQHTPEFRQALPCLEPLYAQADLDGLTKVSLTYAGTPLAAGIRASVDATACRILHGASLLKPSGTPAEVRLEARFGEVPGQLILDRLEMKLADSAVSASGRFLFDNPNLPELALPSSWSVRIDGRAPDAAALASLFPARLEDLKPTGGLTFKIQASGDPMGAELQTCDLLFDKAGIVWLGKKMLLAGPVSYDGQRLATDGLNIVVGRSDVTLVAYIQQPDRAPTGSVVLRGKALDLKEIQDLIQDTSAQVAAWTSAAAPAAPGKTAPAAPRPLSEQLGRWGQRLLGDAQLAAELAVDRVSIVIPEWNTTYELTGLTAEGRLAGRQFSMPRFKCSMNEGAIGGEILLDFRTQPPILSFLYDARDLKMADNLKPFIESTFPGMQVFGKVSQRVSTTQVLAEGSFPKGRGETTLNDGVLRGPGAPDYITAVLPGLKLTEYPFHRMTDDFENKGNGDIDNRMIFEGKAYDIYIFGVTHADGQVEYALGVDLLVSLGSKVLTRTLDQGKLPLMYYTGRIKGTRYAEGPFIRYVLPHEFAYDVFVRRNLLLQLISRIGETPPPIPKPPVVPKDPRRAAGEPKP
ncbi:MAG: hypothetical protein IMZ44_10970 [Planctomycetes bacterium]|nr:hypothetical protein [Planctomycetota bacterium]